MAKKSNSNIEKKSRSISLVSNEDRFDVVYKRIAKQVGLARNNVIRSVNTAMVITYWRIGREIHQEELKGKRRAGYGKELIKGLSERLTQSFGKGFTATNLRYMKLFYLAFPEVQI